jgi:uncharacterized linocin/CFP29 family protein
LDDDVQVVALNRLGVEDIPNLGMVMSVNDHDVLRLCTVAVNVALKSAQLADPELASAMIMFRRAADVIARVEDAIIFNGQPGVGLPPEDGMNGVHPIFRVTGGGNVPGLLDLGREVYVGAESKGISAGEAILNAIVDAVGILESTGHLGPFACVLGEDLFRASARPMPGSMVLPRDSILPFLNGPLLRSSAIPPHSGVVVSLLGEPVEIVVPKDISVRFMQTTPENLHLFRVSQRFVLRVKEAPAVVTLRQA